MWSKIPRKKIFVRRNKNALGKRGERMTDTRPKPPHTPVPTADLMTLTNAVTSTSENMKAVKSKIEEVAQDSRKASDGVIVLNEWSKNFNRRVENLENAPEAHCLKETILSEHEQRMDDSERNIVLIGKSITAMEIEQAGLSKWRSWLTSIFVVVITSLAGVAGKAIWDTATARAEIKQNTETLKRIEEKRQTDRDKLFDAVQAVPSKIQQSLPQVEEKTTIIELESKLNKTERRQLQRLIKKAGIE